ncbi:MAG: hypothetical protein ABIH34_07105 [Nanoarchaeota archaeon]
MTPVPNIPGNNMNSRASDYIKNINWSAVGQGVIVLSMASLIPVIPYTQSYSQVLEEDAPSNFATRFYFSGWDVVDENGTKIDPDTLELKTGNVIELEIEARNSLVNLALRAINHDRPLSKVTKHTARIFPDVEAYQASLDKR